MYLVDLGQENFDTWLLQQYIQYALDCGYPLLLRMLMPSLPRNQIKSLNTSTICYYQNLDMVECVLGLGIVQTLSFRNVTSIPSPSIIRNLIERNVVVSNDSNLLKWSQETEFAIQQEIVADYLKLKRDPPTPETLLTLVHSIHRSIPSKLHLKSQLEDAHISKQDTRFALGDALGFDPPLYGYFSDYEYLFSEDSRSILQRVNLLILLKELDPDRHTRNDVSINYKLSCANSINQIQ
ncbi:hypothetical protein K7432_014574 [Basidiobolus ranarum]|uniref:Uncharacterized protein n=1 Tax=Basidiobolus ranarum TaxID=34480 RepID=A0ABR2WHC1_9FUNG